MKKNCIVAQSGGPTAAINASLAGVVSGVMKSNKFETCYGSLNGITGILNNTLINLSDTANTPGFIEQLTISPAMYLGSCRFKMPKMTDNEEIYQQPAAGHTSCFNTWICDILALLCQYDHTSKRRSQRYHPSPGDRHISCSGTDKCTFA